MVSDDKSFEYLSDIKGEREIPWKAKRLITLRLAQAYKRLKSPKYNRIINCAGYVEFRRYADNSLKLQTGSFCQTRLCPICNWRRSKRMFAQVSRIYDSISEDYGFVFLTLTVRNVGGADLKAQINNIVKAYKSLYLRKQFQDAVRGWVKCFEITHNWKTREYHPHYHVILAVDKSYFTSNLYIKQDDWCLLWKSCLGVDYKPIVDIRTFTESERGKGKEIAEVAKYTIKSSNIMANLQDIKSYSQNIQDEVKKFTDRITDELVLTLDAALASRRLIEYGGICKAKHKELNLDENIDSDLVHTESDSIKNGMSYEIERYRWDIGVRNYIRIDKWG